MSQEAQELHAILFRVYKEQNEQIEAKWKSFTEEERRGCMPAQPLDDRFADISSDTDVAPDFTPDKIAESDPHYFLDVLEFRARTNLYQQAFQVVNGSIPDDTVIKSLPDLAGVDDCECQSGFFFF